MLKRILVLDDNQDVLDIIKEALVYGQFEVKVTSNSADIMETIETFHPDLLILDYKLNGGNGNDICRQVKTNHQLSDIPVIICSAYLDATETLICGCDATIAKPFGLDELMEKVNGLIYSDM